MARRVVSRGVTYDWTGTPVKTGHFDRICPVKGLEQVQRLHHIVEQVDADRRLGVFCREDVDDVARTRKCPREEFDVVTLILHLRTAA